jgi:hypothetical protein
MHGTRTGTYPSVIQRYHVQYDVTNSGMDTLHILKLCLPLTLE